MKTFEQWYKKEYKEELPKERLDGNWFAEKGLPMVVGCYDCGSTLLLPNAHIDEDGHCFCSSCVC